MNEINAQSNTISNELRLQNLITRLWQLLSQDAKTKATRELAISNRKDDLKSASIHEVLGLIKELHANKHPFITKTLLPELRSLLGAKLLLTVLNSLFDAWKPGIDTIMIGKTNDQIFAEKKDRVRNVMQELSKERLDGRLVFWLGIVLLHDRKSLLKEWPDFINFVDNPKISFWEDIQKRLFTGENVESSFWDRVTNSAPEMQATTETTTHEIKETMAQANG
jgi:hypothetical protein